MKNLFSRISFGLIDMVCFIGGISLFTFNILSFTAGGNFLRDTPDYAFDYYYPFKNKLYATIGISLIVLGIVIRLWRKDKINSN